MLKIQIHTPTWKISSIFNGRISKNIEIIIGSESNKNTWLERNQEINKNTETMSNASPWLMGSFHACVLGINR